MVVNKNGFLESFLKNVKADTNRQSYPEVFFYDQGPWTVKYETLRRTKKTKDGPGPWWWMGKNCIPIEREWVTGKDIHNNFDIEITKWWIENKLNSYK